MEIAPGVYSMGQRRGVRVHAYLFDTDSELTPIDTLLDADGHRVLEEIKRLGRSASDLKRIVLTHGHRSHLGGAGSTQAEERCNRLLPRVGDGHRRGSAQAQSVSLKPAHPLRVYYLQFGLAMGIGKHPPCPVDEVVGNGDHVGPLQVLHAPGHSPGHLAFYWPKRRLLIAGDAIATWPDFSAGWKAFNLNKTQHAQSLSVMAKLDPEVVGVGHGEPITKGGGDRIHELVERGV